MRRSSAVNASCLALAVRWRAIWCRGGLGEITSHANDERASRFRRCAGVFPNGARRIIGALETRTSRGDQAMGLLDQVTGASGGAKGAGANSMLASVSKLLG
jgi:hypothetical protein